MQYKRNRFYDPNTGRFTQEDPIGLAGGLNSYGFTNGNPINFSDPFGLCALPGNACRDMVGNYVGHKLREFAQASMKVGGCAVASGLAIASLAWDLSGGVAGVTAAKAVVKSVALGSNARRLAGDKVLRHMTPGVVSESNKAATKAVNIGGGASVDAAATVGASVVSGNGFNWRDLIPVYGSIDEIQAAEKRCGN